MFIWLLSNSQFVYGQAQSMIVNDSLIILDTVAVDSLNDSIGQFSQIDTVDNSLKYNIDSLNSVILVKGNAFLEWIDRINVLYGEAEKSILRVERPFWLIVVIMGLFTALGLIRVFYFNNFYTIIYGFYNDRVVSQLNKEDTIGTSWAYIFLYIVFTFTLGLFITLYQAYYFDNRTVYLIDFFQNSVVISLLFLVKILIIRIVGVLFDVERIVREYVVFLYLFYFNSVLIIMPLILLMLFLPMMYYKFVLFFFVPITVILFLYRFLKTAYNLIDNFRFSIFYLILYLCTLEIAPILLLVKSLNN